MYRWFAQSLGNVSVNRKLGIGFGLVLLLTLGITFTGWLGIDSVTSRGDKLGNISVIHQYTQDLRLARLGYERNRDDAAVAELEKALANLERQVQFMLGQIELAGDRERLNKQQDAVRQYQQAFTELKQAGQRREASRATLGDSADKAAELIGKVQQRLLQGGDIQQYQEVVQVAALLQQARFQVRGYTYSGKAEFQQTALGAIDQAMTVLKALPGKLAAEFAASLDDAASALAAYRDAVNQFGNAQAASEQALTRMSAQGQLLLVTSQEMSVSQTTVRDQGTQQAKTLLAGATALALLLGVLAAFAITRQIIVPLRQTLAAAERVAGGDLRQDLKADRRDELGQLQASMQRMTQALRELIGGIGDGVTQIASAAEELSAVTEQTSAGVNNQKVETDQVATAMNEMTATVQEVARNAEQASEAALMADQQAREGDKVVGEAISQIERLAGEVVNSSEAMSQLKAESDKIGSVLDVIKSVAQQTNLLALNAAIEAARAGEAGRGFAVVADEVRSLAQRTQQSTEEIEELIASLQNGTERVASVMDSSRALTDSSVELTRRAGDSLGTITRTVSSIQSMNQQIATAAEQQSAVAEEINRSVMNVRDISDQTSAASEETASSSVELARLGTHLQGLVGRFRL
ncbi:methyl-accepting chemotaxis protein [Pseudomonas sp. AA27]|uniref:HAMP domain-containing methyl-accepting chemotaxis protein n=1 Tax=Pseudomonas sp. AA27 TaxID=2908652 RepID=UPI001F2CCE1F|nr:methyl-accepting chemotaxis protein [Pseudomonas sp. AA27]MCF1488863.1 methyl-accepting chemotaxis protein [Pseudomonas sp. AA27]